MISLILGALFFLGLHMLLSGTSLRDRVVGAIGENAFRGLFGTGSLIGLVWMAMAYNTASSDPARMILWGGHAALFVTVDLLVLIAVFFVGAGLLTPNPTASGGEQLLTQGIEPRGILRITRHPFLWGILVWAFAHILSNGDMAGIVFFGTFAVLTFSGSRSIDAKRRKRFGENWARFEEQTSNIPFAAIVNGYAKINLAEIGAVKFLAAAALYIVFLYSHLWLFGVSPLPAGWSLPGFPWPLP